MQSSDLWVILLASSRYYYNYRHFANTATIYSIVKALGVDDDHIVFLDASDVLNDYRNPFRGQVFYENPRFFPNPRNLLNSFLAPEFNKSRLLPSELSEDYYEVDYRGDEVNIKLLSDLLLDDLPLTENSKILFYLTGHGGDNFFKFHDYEEWNALALVDLFQQLYYRQRYHEVLLILDTCQASTMVSSEVLLNKIPFITVLASSQPGENSYSYYPQEDLGIPIIDRFTFLLFNFFYDNYLYPLEKPFSSTNGKQRQSRDWRRRRLNALSVRARNLNLLDLFRSIDPEFIFSNPSLTQSSRSRRAVKDILLLEYFSNLLPTRNKTNSRLPSVDFPFNLSSKLQQSSNISEFPLIMSEQLHEPMNILPLKSEVQMEMDRFHGIYQFVSFLFFLIIFMRLMKML